MALAKISPKPNMTPLRKGKPKLTAIAAKIRENLLEIGKGFEEKAASKSEPEGANGEPEFELPFPFRFSSPCCDISEEVEFDEFEVFRGKNLGIPVEETVGTVSD